MKISVKLITVQIFYILLLFVGSALSFYFYAIPQVERIETRQGFKDISRVKYRITEELDMLAILATDWGKWDETYKFINDLNRTYEKSNLTDKALFDLDLDFIFMVNINGDVIWKQFSAHLKKFTTATIWQADNWSEQHSFIALMSDQKKGLIYSGLGVVLVAGSNIVPSSGEGNSRGYIFFGKLITNKLVNKFSKELELPIELSIDNHRDELDTHFISNHQKIVHGLIKLANSSAHILSISLTQPRPFFQEALVILKFSLLIILGMGIFSSVITFLILRKILINPIMQLGRQAYRFGRDQSSMPIKLLHSNDELGQLSASLVNMGNELKRVWGLQEHEKNEYLTASYTDELTQLKNRRYMEYLLNKQQTWSTAKHWAFLMLDIDHFKKVNDTWGHQVGDIVLQQFSSLITEVCRGSDIIFRTGGEEFVVVCEETTQVQSCHIVERIRIAVESFEFGPAGNSFKVTCSIGFYAMYNTKTNVDWNSKIKLADCAMYAAKRSGRNTWVGLAINQQSPLIDNYQLPSDVDLLVADINNEKLLVFSAQQNTADIKWR